MKNRRVIVIGLDGATFDLIKPWCNQGKLPTLQRILSEGSHCLLRSTVPPVTPLAWSSFATGMDPSGHGIYGFLDRKPGTYDWYAVDATSRKGTTFWAWAADHSKQVAISNMPMTYPPDEIPNGFVLSGMGVPDVDVRFATPEEFRLDLLDRFRPDQLIEQPISLFDAESYLDYLIQSIDDNLAINLYLLDHYTIDLLATVFFATDRVQHFYWNQMVHDSKSDNQKNAIFQVYQYADKAIKVIMDRYPDYTLMIMSDHGAGPYRSLISLNQWLAQNGWLHWVDERLPDTDHSASWKKAYRDLGHTIPGPVRRGIKRLIPKGALAKVRRELTHWTMPVDWSKTMAYSAGFGGNIFLNLKGREPLGQVKSNQVEMLLDEIKQGLLSLRDPETGEKVAASINCTSELYGGDHKASAPDLIVSWRDGYYCMSGIGDGNNKIFQGNLTWPGTDLIHTAEHRQYGIFAAIGPGIKRKAQLGELNIIDLAPTLIHLLDLPIPASMQGRAALKLFDKSVGDEMRFEESSEDLPRSLDSAYSLEQERAIQNQLRNLGYLD
jgi:predicted AlkP superfamily phosphohydrolase/phosphomutase